MKTPRPYQIKSIRAAIDRNVLIADECGLGKTFQSVTAVDRYQAMLTHGHAKLPVLIICKKSARQQWIDEISEETNRIAIILDKAPDQPIREPLWIVTHYEALLNTDRWHRSFYAAVILDEAHYIKNNGSDKNPVQRTRAVKKLKALRKIALTGTPIESCAAEAWSILNWLYPQRYRSYWKFFDQYANYEMVWIGKGEQTRKAKPGTRDPQGFAAEHAPFTFQRTKMQVLPDLPPKIFQTVHIPLDGEQKEIYDAIDQSTDIECRLPDGKILFIGNELTKITYLQRTTSDPGFFAPSNSVKFDWVIDYIDDNPNTPMIIFTRFSQTAQRIQETVAKLHRSDILVGTIDAIGESLNLQWASVAIFVDLHWSSIKMTQAIERTHRMDIIESKHIIYLIAPGTIDELIMSAIKNKWSEQELIKQYINRRH